MTLDLYQTPLRYGGAYDELSADGVNPRAHWAHLMESLRAKLQDNLNDATRRAYAMIGREDVPTSGARSHG